MIKKVIILVTVGVLALGGASLAYANEKDDEKSKVTVKTEISTIYSERQNNMDSAMMDIME
jgi:hypothetical protein